MRHGEKRRTHIFLKSSTDYMRKPREADLGFGVKSEVGVDFSLGQFECELLAGLLPIDMLWVVGCVAQSKVESWAWAPHQMCYSSMEVHGRSFRPGVGGPT